MAPRRLSRPGWKLLGGVLLIGIVAVLVSRFGSHTDFFRVHAVEIRGARNLRPEEIVRVLPIRAGQSLFDDLSAVRAAADSIPGLASVRVGRRPPSTIVVSIQETEPIAYVMRRGTLAMLGEQGEVLGFDPTVAAPDLPLVREADSLVTRFLARVRETDAGFFARIVSGARVGDDILVTADRQRYWFRRDAGAEVIRAVMAVEQDLDDHGPSWAELDARFADQIVVRGKSG
jgi:cell division septal protein FtsQ